MDVAERLNAHQRKFVMDTARLMPVEKRDLYLRRLAAMLRLRGGHFADADVAEIVRLAGCGLIHRTADSAASALTPSAH
jgi:hypothetical protein